MLRCTKIALIVFGLGLMLGFALVVAVDQPLLEPVAAALMALGLLALPLALVLDGPGLPLLAWVGARPSTRKPGKSKRRAPARRRQPPRGVRRKRG